MWSMCSLIYLSASEPSACINLRLYRPLAIPLATPLSHRLLSLTNSHAHSSTCHACASGPASTPMPVGVLESYPQCWVPESIQPKNDITESHFDSHLSGPRVLINPLSAVAQLIRLALPPFRYVIRDNSWLLKNGHQGRDIPPACAGD